MGTGRGRSGRKSIHGRDPTKRGRIPKEERLLCQTHGESATSERERRRGGPEGFRKKAKREAREKRERQLEELARKREEQERDEERKFMEEEAKRQEEARLRREKRDQHLADVQRR